MVDDARHGLALALALLGVLAVAEARGQEPVSGTFLPDGPPEGDVVRTPAGDACVIDLVQGYEVRGSLSGTLELDYRIFVDGPCGSPQGTFRESWIAHGTFAGTVDDEPASATLWYRADVEEGGEVSGAMGFSGDLSGMVSVSGRFSDGSLSYLGAVRREEGRPRAGRGSPRAPSGRSAR